MASISRDIKPQSLTYPFEHLVFIYNIFWEHWLQRYSKKYKYYEGDNESEVSDPKTEILFGQAG